MLIAAGPRITMNRQGRMQNIMGNRILTGQLHRLLLGVLPPLQSQLGRLHLHRLGNGHAELLGLGQGHDELAELGELHAVGHGEEGVPPPHAGPDVLATPGRTRRREVPRW